MEAELLEVSSQLGGRGAPAGAVIWDLHNSSGMRDVGRPGCKEATCGCNAGLVASRLLVLCDY